MPLQGNGESEIVYQTEETQIYKHVCHSAWVDVILPHKAKIDSAVCCYKVLRSSPGMVLSFSEECSLHQVACTTWSGFEKMVDSPH